MTDEEFDKIWDKAKEMDEKRYAWYDALPEVEKKRLEKEFEENGYDRFLEDPLGGGDEEED